jgi:hypothetical protein
VGQGGEVRGNQSRVSRRIPRGSFHRFRSPIRLHQRPRTNLSQCIIGDQARTGLDHFETNSDACHCAPIGLILLQELTFRPRQARSAREAHVPFHAAPIVVQFRAIPLSTSPIALLRARRFRVRQNPGRSREVVIGPRRPDARRLRCLPSDRPRHRVGIARAGIVPGEA